jgi:hypothetical protein
MIRHFRGSENVAPAAGGIQWVERGRWKGTAMADDFFEVPSSQVLTTEGSVRLPMLFYDVSVRQLNFFVEYDSALSRLEGTGLAPCRFFNGKALASLILYNYRDVTIGEYDEVTIVLLVYPPAVREPRLYLPNLARRDGHKWTVGGYVLEMPVTIPDARAAGREIWGYPKYLTDIPLAISDRDFSYEVMDEPGGSPVLTVECTPGPGITMRASDLVTFSNHEDTILRTVVDVDAACRNSPRGKLRIRAGTTEHRFASNVRELGLDRLKPFVVQSTDSFRSRLNRGWPVASQKTPPPPYAVEGERPARWPAGGEAGLKETFRKETPAV